jgi:beta-glucosidase
LRLISIGPEMPRDKIREEIAAGRIGGTFNSRTAPKTGRCRTRPCAAA